ncbi:hypothetical protein K457DRAFT_271809 [Linnemannia elongata AG-77]|uniref:Transmembrane protein n=1 Tax=Linnemannia elongata AG-77 TaxID=1314771 RepID=A0A197K6N1_9FUNG|nr:hypothetical protein K457DRAFT_271809 [Linnemannia elongata AG-77]
MPDHVPANEMNAQFFHKRKNRRNRRMALGSHTNMHEEQHTFVPLSLSISFPLSISSPYFRLIIYLFIFWFQVHLKERGPKEKRQEDTQMRTVHGVRQKGRTLRSYKANSPFSTIPPSD